MICVWEACTVLVSDWKFWDIWMLRGGKKQSISKARMRSRAVAQKGVEEVFDTDWQVLDG